jgi:formiminoglutamase
MDIHQFLITTNKGIIPESSFVYRHVKLFQNDSDITVLDYDVAILGIPDNEDSKTFNTATQIRKILYSLSALSNSLNILDLGNIITGNTFNDTCYAISEVVTEINIQKSIIILIGGTSQYNTGIYLAFEKIKTPVNIVCIDSTISIDKIPSLQLKKIINQKELSSFFNFINIGYQSYFVERETLNFINDSYFEAYRLGSVRSNVNEMEPVLRDSNFVSFSLNAIKHSDAPGTNFSSPNGISGEDACQLSFFAGHSNRINSFGVFDLLPENDLHANTAKLASQIVWYFLEGFSNAIYEEPDETPQNFTKYLIHLNQTDQNIAFYKSNLTNRWWMEIIFPENNHKILLSCSEADYGLTCSQEIPERWWRTFRRISH